MSQMIITKPGLRNMKVWIDALRENYHRPSSTAEFQAMTPPMQEAHLNVLLMLTFTLDKVSKKLHTSQLLRREEIEGMFRTAATEAVNAYAHHLQADFTRPPDGKLNNWENEGVVSSRIFEHTLADMIKQASQRFDEFAVRSPSPSARR
jgi:hypothetical protein